MKMGIELCVFIVTFDGKFDRKIIGTMLGERERELTT